MQIKILGNGGAINDGLPYNSFLVDDFFLAETPPDIMTSLFRERTDLSKLRVIYISHFHGDHYFGLPFLALRLFFNSAGNPMNYRIMMLGPADIKNKLKDLCSLAFGENHPVNDWMDGNFIFNELDSESEIHIEYNMYLKIFSMYHLTGTFGFSLYKNGRIAFSYFADTIWNDGLLCQIKLFPEIILADLNGEPSDPKQIHMSEKDIIEKAIPYSEGRVTFYGTHLKMQKESVHKNIRYVHPGDIIKCSV